MAQIAVANPETKALRRRRLPPVWPCRRTKQPTAFQAAPKFHKDPVQSLGPPVASEEPESTTRRLSDRSKVSVPRELALHYPQHYFFGLFTPWTNRAFSASPWLNLLSVHRPMIMSNSVPIGSMTAHGLVPNPSWHSDSQFDAQNVRYCHVSIAVPPLLFVKEAQCMAQ